MSAPVPSVQPTFGAYDLAAFLTERESETVFEHFCERQMIGSAHVQRGNIEQAIRFVEKQPRSPRLLVVDISGIDMPLPAIDRLADACEPGVKVVVIGDQQDVALFRQLLRIGVADYLVKPLSVELVAQTVGAELDPAAVRHDGRTGKIVTFTGTRGGVGTTSLATSFAWLLGNTMSRRVAFVDLDPYGGGGPMLLDIDVGGLGEALTNVAQLDNLLLDRTMVRHGPRLMCLSAEEELDQASTIERDAFDQVLSALEKQFHYVVIDLPRRPGPFYRFVLERSAVQVLVADRTLPSVHNAIRLLPLTGHAGRRTLLVLNDHRPAKTSALKRADIERTIGRAFDLIVPYDRTVPDRGDNLGEPLAKGRNPFAVALRTLAGNLSGQRLNNRKRLPALLGGG